jgi:hypothetical protein
MGRVRQEHSAAVGVERYGSKQRVRGRLIKPPG